MTVVLFSVVLLGAMVLGIPIAFALLITAGALMWQLSAFDWQLIALQMTSGADSFPLLAVPFFLLAGEAMNAGGLSRRLVELGLSLVGHLRGGLGYVAVITAILLASLSGSATPPCIMGPNRGHDLREDHKWLDGSCCCRRVVPEVARVLALLARKPTVEISWPHNRHRQTKALGRQDATPLLN